MTGPRETREFLGRGWKFPLQVTPGGRIAQARFEQRIEEAVYLIVSTAPGERVMLPDFGCGIHDLAFPPNTRGTPAAGAEQDRRARVTYEPRIDVLGVAVDGAPGQANLLVSRVGYRIRANNAAGNRVYPFLLREGP